MQLTPEETTQLRIEYKQQIQKAMDLPKGSFEDWFISRINTLLEEREKGLVEKVENCKKPVDLLLNYSIVGDVEKRAFNRGMDVAINIIKNQ